jgi:hypothetical protein
MVYFERKPIRKLWDAIKIESAAFFDCVRRGDEPDPFGSPIEAPLIAKLFPTVPDKVLDLRNDPEADKWSNDVQQYQYHKEAASGHDRAEAELKARLMGLAKDNESVLLPCGVNYRIAKSGKGRTIKTFIPENPEAAPVPRDTVLAAG